MASVRAQSAPPGPKANPDYAIVPFDLPKRCAGCGCTSEQKPWGAHMVVLSPDQKTVLQQKPHSSACQECKEAAYAAQVPSRTRWEDLQPSLSDPKKLSTLQNWCALRSGSKAHRFIPQGAKEVRQIGHRREESYDVLTMTEFQRRFPGTKPSSIPGVRVDTVQNSRGEPEEVILTRGAEPPRLVVYHQVDAQLEDNYLLPSSHLRKEQGSEFWESSKPKLATRNHKGLPPWRSCATWYERQEARFPGRKRHAHSPEEQKLRQAAQQKRGLPLMPPAQQTHGLRPAAHA
jgi:hypothetical protein